MWQQFQIYGDRIRVAPNLVLFRDPESYADIYGVKSNVRRSQLYDAISRNHNEINTLSTSNDAIHARKRKILNQCFTEKSIRAASGFIIRHVDRWNQLITNRSGSTAEWSETIDFSEEAEKLVFDIMGDLSFGKSFDLKEPGHNPLSVVPQTIVDYMRFLYAVGSALIWFPTTEFSWLTTSI